MDGSRETASGSNEAIIDTEDCFTFGARKLGKSLDFLGCFARDFELEMSNIDLLCHR